MFSQLFAVFFFISAASLNSIAQASYSGGQGGGYSSQSISLSNNSITDDQLVKKTFDATVFPNPLNANETLKARISGFKPEQQIIIIVSDLIGSRLHVATVNAASEISISIPNERLSKGIYLVTFQHGNSKITKRFTYTN